ncbi:4-oxalocrotonate tautomerase [Clostridium estertheticum]|uniref:4-oxalocrotonate tautomerase n=1 Tax=Clostridium estertheticum TaxID=238834 RepID=A0A5N7IUJ2_9CLOT|nr:4-oxalocrotonate tautomerase DmpI [Clostridium estertheticum]MBW9173483.1 tautomerase family protein [Clostridium estertheticum]MPQ33975.1 4-oxalocrotonate tautomerase [Clostridium estertheticum]MPQ64774.1 4-oxalocrotonate tautomerase [Clostridium estertheticum]WLC77603.1 tautomerase family protein [Clostridium estertheticum]
MPYITIEGGQMTTEQKQQLIERMTNVASEIMKVPSEFYITTIKELSDENIGIGGKTIDKIKEEYKNNH